MTPESVDELFTIAWRAKPAPGALAAVVRPFVDGSATAKTLCQTWLSPPLEPGGELPTQLPTGEPLPPSRHPWGREGSPLPGVDLDAAGTITLAERVVDETSRPHRRPATF